MNRPWPTMNWTRWTLISRRCMWTFPVIWRCVIGCISIWGRQLVYSCFAGSAQTTDEAQLTAIEGPQPVFFFAPIQIRKRNAEWGPERVSQYIGEGLQRFYRTVSEGPAPLLEVVVDEGYEAARQLVSRLYHGQVPPTQGNIIKL